LFCAGGTPLGRGRSVGRKPEGSGDGTSPEGSGGRPLGGTGAPLGGAGGTPVGGTRVGSA